MHFVLRPSALILFILISSHLYGQTVCSLESREKVEQMLAHFSRPTFSKMSPSDLTLTIGEEFLQTPYVEKTLELPGPEQLVINLQGVDCTTFVETVITLARMATTGQSTFEAFERELAHLRYRNGKNEGYASRLHYFSDWIYQNQQKGILKDVTEKIGGSSYPNVPSFMSENPKFYAQLADPDYLKEIKNTELIIKERRYFYIPKSEIRELETNIQSGDLIAITTSMANLDIVHTGFAIEQNGRIHLLHASSNNMKVEISEKPLSDYLAANKSQSGIMVARLTGN